MLYIAPGTNATEKPDTVADESVHLVLTNAGVLLDRGEDPATFARTAFNALKPGGFAICLAPAHTNHHFAVALEDLGFEIRDAITWHWSGEADADAVQSVSKLLTVAQKPKDGTFVDNWAAHGTGLVDVGQRWAGMFPTNAIETASGPTGPRGQMPMDMIRHLLRLFSAPGQTVYDPVMGEGDIALAALIEGRNFIGDDDPESLASAEARIVAAFVGEAA